jgi:hypothetical protein
MPDRNLENNSIIFVKEISMAFHQSPMANPGFLPQIMPLFLTLSIPYLTYYSMMLNASLFALPVYLFMLSLNGIRTDGFVKYSIK